MDLVRWFYGWTMVVATFVLTFIGYGVAFSFAAFFPYLQHEFGATRGTISLLFSLSGFFYFALGAVTGPLADRFGRVGDFADLTCCGSQRKRKPESAQRPPINSESCLLPKSRQLPALIP
jgi:MFS family permease